MRTILWIVAVSAILIWLLAMAGIGILATIGKLAHLLLALGLILIVVNVFSSRRTSED